MRFLCFFFFPWFFFFQQPRPRELRPGRGPTLSNLDLGASQRASLLFFPPRSEARALTKKKRSDVAQKIETWAPAMVSLVSQEIYPSAVGVKSSPGRGPTLSKRDLGASQCASLLFFPPSRVMLRRRSRPGRRPSWASCHKNLAVSGGCSILEIWPSAILEYMTW